MKQRFSNLLSLGLLAAGVFAFAPAVPAATITIDYSQEGAGEGFNDATLGAARKASLEAAADIWAAQLIGTIDIVIEAVFTPLGGTAMSALLGQAGPTNLVNAVAGGVTPSTFYPYALADQLENTDIGVVFADTSDIEAEFNSDVDGPVVLGATDFSYRTSINDPVPGGTVDFLGVALHELGHGLGFLSLINISTGALPNVDVFSRMLARSPFAVPGDLLINLPDDAARLAATTSVNGLGWTGPVVIAERAAAQLMYAPASPAGGSSVSHWDTTLTPNELMEPFATGDVNTIGLAKHAFADIGWKFVNFETRAFPTGNSAATAFGTLGCTIDLASSTVAGNVNVDLLATEPANLASEANVLFVLDRHWKIDGIQNSTFNGTITFSYTNGDLTAAGVTNEGNLRVFRSDDNGGNWTEVDTTTNAAGNTVTANNVTDFSLWGIAQIVPPLGVRTWHIFD